MCEGIKRSLKNLSRSLMPRQELEFSVVAFCIACGGLFMVVAEHHKNLKS